MNRATYTIGQEPQQDTAALTKDRNAQPLRLEFLTTDKATIRAAIEAHKAEQNARDALRGAA